MLKLPKHLVVSFFIVTFAVGITEGADLACILMAPLMLSVKEVLKIKITAVV